jgi:hypothetical protein
MLDSGPVEVSQSFHLTRARVAPRRETV